MARARTIRRRLKRQGKSGIYIKPSKRGSFTAWCKRRGYGGVVNSRCIAAGKASGNAAIRKKATFAANARKFKH